MRVATVTADQRSAALPGDDRSTISTCGGREFLIPVGLPAAARRPRCAVLPGSRRPARQSPDRRQVANDVARGPRHCDGLQSYALYRHERHDANLGFGLKLCKMPKAGSTRGSARRSGHPFLDKYLDRKPKAPGGQRQRVVSVARSCASPRSSDGRERFQPDASFASRPARNRAHPSAPWHYDRTSPTRSSDDDGRPHAVMKDGLLQAGTRGACTHPANLFVADSSGPRHNSLTAHASGAWGW
jgi:hypothetical protein